MNIISYSSFRPHHTAYLLAVLTIAALTMASCGSSSTDPNDGGGGGSTPLEPTFSNVLDIFNGSCGGSGCHIGESTSGVRLDSYSNVMNSVGDQYGKEIVQKNDAANSPLVDKIESNPEFGVRMPKGGSALSTDKIDLIKQWINDGAKNN